MNLKLHFPKRLWLLKVTFLIVITEIQLKLQLNPMNVIVIKYDYQDEVINFFNWENTTNNTLTEKDPSFPFLKISLKYKGIAVFENFFHLFPLYEIHC